MGAEYHLLWDGAFQNGWNAGDSSEAVMLDGRQVIHFDGAETATLDLPASDTISLRSQGFIELTLRCGDDYGGGPITVGWRDRQDINSLRVALDRLQAGQEQTRYLPLTAFEGGDFNPDQACRLRISTKDYEQAFPVTVTSIRLAYPADVIGPARPVGVTLKAYRLNREPPTLAPFGSDLAIGNGHPVCSTRTDERWAGVPAILKGATTLAPIREDKGSELRLDAYTVEIDQEATLFAITGGDLPDGSTSPLPRWLNEPGWRQLGLDIACTRRDMRRWSVYARHVPAGTLDLANTVHVKHVVYAFLPGHLDLDMLAMNAIRDGHRPLHWALLLGYRGTNQHPDLRLQLRPEMPSNLDRKEYWTELPPELAGNPVLIAARDDKHLPLDARMYQVQVSKPCTIFALLDGKHRNGPPKAMAADGWSATALQPKNSSRSWSVFSKQIDAPGTVFLANSNDKNAQGVVYIFRPGAWSPGARPAVESVLLVTGTGRTPLTNGQVLTAKDISDGISILANGNRSTSALTFTLSGPVSHEQREGKSPFMLFGDEEGQPRLQALTPGAYTLVITAYVGNTAGDQTTLRFTVTGESASPSSSTTQATADRQTKADQQTTSRPPASPAASTASPAKPAQPATATPAAPSLIVSKPIYQEPLFLFSVGAVVAFLVLGLVVLAARKDSRALNRLADNGPNDGPGSILARSKEQSDRQRSRQSDRQATTRRRSGSGRSSANRKRRR